MDFRYAEYPPPAETRPWVLSLWSFHAERAPDASEPPYTVWPDGCISLGVICAPSGFAMPVCVGPRATAMHPPVRPHTALWGVRLWPDAAQELLGIAPSDLRDHFGPVPAPLASAVEPLANVIRALPDPRGEGAIAALEQWTRALATNASAPEPRVRAAVGAIAEARGEVLMDDVASAAGLSLRQLQRTFRARTGLTPREYARVRRLRESLARSMDQQTQGWSRVAAETGFVDHAHLTREFVALTGLPPTRAAGQLRRTKHVGVTP